MRVRLESKRVTGTVERLTLRIKDRFGECGLYEVCTYLHEIAKETEQMAERIARPVWGLRAVTALLVMAFLVSLGAILVNYEMGGDVTVWGLVQTIDAGGNILILIGLGAAYLWSIETRVKRTRAIRAINALRDVAHVIDMKQLTKDPDRLGVIHLTRHSPRHELDAFGLGRYLDYCTEALSLVSKLGYLYVEHFQDSEVNKATTELENLCNGLSRKIWQKIVILRARHQGQ